MPHDQKSRPLKVGDRVVIPGTVTAVLQSDGYCNCSVELDYTMPPENSKVTLSSINTRQLLRAETIDRQENEIDAVQSDKLAADKQARLAKQPQTAAVDAFGRPIDVHGNVLPRDPNREGIDHGHQSGN